MHGAVFQKHADARAHTVVVGDPGGWGIGVEGGGAVGTHLAGVNVAIEIFVEPQPQPLQLVVGHREGFHRERRTDDPLELVVRHLATPIRVHLFEEREPLARVGRESVEVQVEGGRELCHLGIVGLRAPRREQLVRKRRVVLRLLLLGHARVARGAKHARGGLGGWPCELHEPVTTATTSDQGGHHRHHKHSEEARRHATVRRACA